MDQSDLLGLVCRAWPDVAIRGHGKCQMVKQLVKKKIKGTSKKRHRKQPALGEIPIIMVSLFVVNGISWQPERALGMAPVLAGLAGIENEWADGIIQAGKTWSLTR